MFFNAIKILMARTYQSANRLDHVQDDKVRLAQQGIELVCPHRRRRKKPPTQDDRKLRRYRKRWKVERSISGLGHFRRLWTRGDRSAEIDRTFVHRACAIMTCRYL